ncbi:MAG: hypothetical protein HWE10_10130 [Gammaproteobacteria bacterium]|nr:hypothetical protein [Gammaproteobacteria bacterium]
MDNQDKLQQQNTKPKSENSYQNIKMLALLRRGYEFKFQDGDAEISCWGSSFSGQETITINGSVVSKLRNLTSRKSLHTFQYEDHTYEVEFDMVSIRRSELHCILIKDGVHFGTKKARPTNLTNNKSLSIWRAFAEGVVFGVIGAALGFGLAKLFKSDTDTTALLVDSINLFFT